MQKQAILDRLVPGCDAMERLEYESAVRILSGYSSIEPFHPDPVALPLPHVTWRLINDILESDICQLICGRLSSNDHPAPINRHVTPSWLRDRALVFGIPQFNAMVAYALSHQGEMNPEILDDFEGVDTEWLAVNTPYCLTILYGCKESPELLGIYGGYLSWDNLEPNKELLQQIDSLIRAEGWSAITPQVLRNLSIAIGLFATRDRITSELIADHCCDYPEIMEQVIPYLTQYIGRNPNTIIYTDSDAEPSIKLFMDLFDALSDEEELRSLASWIRSNLPDQQDIFKVFDDLLRAQGIDRGSDISSEQSSDTETDEGNDQESLGQQLDDAF